MLAQARLYNTDASTYLSLSNKVQQNILKTISLLSDMPADTFQAFLDKCDVLRVPLANVIDEISPQTLLNCNTLDDYRNIAADD